jgi:hypothetical protein
LVPTPSTTSHPHSQRRRRRASLAAATPPGPCLRVEPSLDPRSARRQHLVRHLHAAGPRPVLEALIEVAAGNDLDAVLQRYARIPVRIYHAQGADRLLIHIVTVIGGGAL